MTPLSYQLYSSRNFGPLDETLGMLARLGYSEVEGYPGVCGDATATRTALDTAGLTMPSAHFGLHDLEKNQSATLYKAEVLGITSLFCPAIGPQERPDTVDGWTAFGTLLQRLAEAYSREGITLGWHNHDFEFRPLNDGSVPLMHILDAAPDLCWEADIAWIVRGGGEPLDWIAAYAPRIAAVHIKDIAAAGTCVDEDGWADVGHGVIDWPAILAALADAPVRHRIIEHDNPSDDARFAQRSLAAVRDWGI